MKQYLSLIAASLMLASLAPLQARAAQRTWSNGSGNFLWDLTSTNWSSLIWSDGDDAVFGATGVGTVSLGGPITVRNQTINAAGYTIAGSNGSTLTLLGTAPTITVNAANSTNASSLYGTNGLTVQGTGTLVLTGDPANLDGNHYTGGTYVKRGTLVLAAPNANGSGTSYAVDSIEALDTGATVKFSPTFNGVNYATVRDQIAAHSSAFASHLHMTGGTFDLNDDPKNQHMPVPEGAGLIINTGTNVQAGVVMVADGNDHEFSGVIADGGPLLGDNISPSQGPGRQIGIVTFAAQINGGGGTLTLSGSNTYSGSTRIDQGATIKLAGNGTIGFPTDRLSFTGPTRIYGPGGLDLNGHNQTVALMTSGNASGKIYNSAVGTVSTLTIGYGNEQSFGRNAGMQFIDNLGTGGILALKKVATGPAFITPGTLLPATNCIQTLSGVNTYSGDTTVEGGHLRMAAASAVSPNSTFRLFTVAQGQCPDSSVSLILDYSGTAPVKGLFINGVQMPPGVYGSSTTPITGTGTITVTSPKTWNNGSGNFLWDLTSTNWSSLIWSDGDDAVFGATGVGTVSLGGPITVRNQTISAAGYTIAGAANPLTLAGTAPAITVNAANSTNAASLNGTNGLTVQGTGTLVLTGDPANLDGNHYTGGTYVRSGTLVLAAPNANAAGTSYAVDSIEALDVGATVKFGTTFNGSAYVSPTLHQVASHATAFTSRLHMTGGTFDLNDEPRNQHLPVPEGTGLIVNTGTNVQSGLIIYADGQNHTFSGVIADGGLLVGDNVAGGATPQGPGRQIGIVSFAAGINGGEWTLTGSNTYSGSTRLQFGSVKLAGNGTIGFPTATKSLTGPLRIYGPSHLDLNGRNQTIALMTSGDAGGKIYNSAAGTVSTLTIGYGNEQTARTAIMQFIDNPGTGGLLALKKVATGPGYIVPATGLPATNCAQTLSGVNTYSGDTTVEGGALIMATASAVSSNSVFRLFTVAQGQCPESSVSLVLSYAGTAPVRQLWINGVQRPNGVYGAGTPGIHPSSTGTLTVTGFAPVSLGVSQSGNTLTFSWAGVYKLQTKTNNIIGPWFDYPSGGTSPVNVTVDRTKGSVFFRLSTY